MNLDKFPQNVLNMKSLCDYLVLNNVIRSEDVYHAMLKTDRADFIDPFYAYFDSSQSINYNSIISAPHMHAYPLEYLKDFLKPGNKVLDVGAGSGYLTTAFSKMMNDQGRVVGIEHIKELYELAKKNISKNNSELLNKQKIILVEGDGRSGYKQLAPYDVIHVGAAAEMIPDDLIEQLAPGGRLMIPVGKNIENQFIYIVDKNLKGEINWNKVLSVRYVPLTSKDKQLGSI